MKKQNLMIKWTTILCQYILSCEMALWHGKFWAQQQLCRTQNDLSVDDSDVKNSVYLFSISNCPLFFFILRGSLKKAGGGRSRWGKEQIHQPWLLVAEMQQSCHGASYNDFEMLETEDKREGPNDNRPTGARTNDLILQNPTRCSSSHV